MTSAGGSFAYAHERVFAAPGGLDDEALLLQIERGEVTNVGFVVDDKDFLGHCGSHLAFGACVQYAVKGRWSASGHLLPAIAEDVGPGPPT